MKKFLLLVCVCASVAAIILATTQRYPVVIVNMSWITAKDFNVANAASERFYLRALETYGKQKPGEFEKTKLTAEIRRATLDRLIEEVLIRNEAKKEIDALSAKIEEKIKNVDNQKLQNPIREMYGLSIEEFRYQVLEPQATQELLAAALAAKGDSLMAQAAIFKKMARVILLFPGVIWTEKGVELKK